jgi:enoyl-CoA hydratase/carnithine racemase
MSSSSSKTIFKSHPTPGITVLTINRPEARNAINPPTALALYAAIKNFENDAAQKVLVLNGANGTFCAGFDLKSLSSSKDDASGGKPHYDEKNFDGTIAPMGPSRLQIKKPVIVAVSGYAVAGGLELSLLGDMRVVEEGSVFGVFCRRWGVSWNPPITAGLRYVG